MAEASDPIPTSRRPVTRVYIDGFNLYYGALRRTPYKWLDLLAFSRNLLPNNEIDHVTYCTARVSNRGGQNPETAQRQKAYLLAVNGFREIEIVYGHFLTQKVRRPRADGGGLVEVLKTEEKGSDVNLATRLVADAFEERFEVAAVVTNDSDLVEPIRVVQERLNLPVGVIFPLRPGRRMSQELRKQATFVRSIRQSALRASQLPDEVVTPNGSRITKPASW